MADEPVTIPVDATNMRPPMICRNCASHALMHRATDAVAAYCEHTGVGAFFTMAEGWQTVMGRDAWHTKNMLGLLMLEQDYQARNVDGMTKQ